MADLRPERLHLQDANRQHISVCGRSFIADKSGALFWTSERALVVADLDLKPLLPHDAPQAFNELGDVKDTLLSLARNVDDYSALTIIALGLDRALIEGRATVDKEVLQILKILQNDCEWIWVSGDAAAARKDEDQEKTGVGSAVGGALVPELLVAGMTLRHKPSRYRATHEIAGHLIPAATLLTYGHQVVRPCFIGNGQRLILPAFGSFANGRNVLGSEFSTLFGNDGLNVWMMGQDGVYPVSSRRLV